MTAKPYLLGAASVAVATASSVLMRPITHATDSPLFVAAVMMSAWLGGLGPSLLATGLAVVALDGLMSPAFVVNEDVVARLAIFALAALFVSALNAARRRAQAGQAAALASEREARAEAEAATRAKDEFVTMVAHELRTPLAAVAAWTAALHSEKLRPEQRARALAAIQRTVVLQGRVVEDLVDLSRVARGRLALQIASVDLRAVVEATVEAFVAVAAARGVTVATRLPPVGPTVLGDAARLQQVVSNLVGNALRHSPPDATIHVDLDAADGDARIAVRDEGCGIAPDLLPWVFDRYRQGDPDSAGGGLGLGLAIVRALVELHHGRVEATSAGAGQGATFTVFLRLSEARAEDSVSVSS
jgi:signal transduction histidine kinase